MLNAIAIKIIRFYQRYLSPRKGYVCAHHALHNGGSCSFWAISVIESQGVLAMISQFGGRIAECSEASKRLSARKEENKKENQPCELLYGAAEVGCCIFSSWT